MRRFLVPAFCVGALALSAPAASAQVKDPFDPLLSEGTASGTAGSTGDEDPSTTDPGTTTTTTDPEPRPDVPMPSTGWDPSGWLGLGALALALGSGMLLLGRVLDPLP